MADPQKPSPGGDPVRLYAEDDHRLPRTVERELTSIRDSLIAGLSTGGAKDFPEYREKVGEIRSLNRAIQICQEAGKALSGN